MLDVPFDDSFSKNAVIGEGENYKQVQLAHKSIFNELIDNAILELCFEVHRAAKLNLDFPISDEQSFFKQDTMHQSGKSEKSNKIVSIPCFICGQSKGADKFANHLYTCMNPSERQARAKKMNFKEPDSDDDIDDKYPAKKDKKSKSWKGKPRLPGNSLSKPSQNSLSNIKSMSLDERKAFFDLRCGAVTKRSKKLCSNSRKCSIHTRIEQDSVRHDFLRGEPDNGQIDVDTVETSDIKPSFSTCDGSVIDYSSEKLAYF